MVVSLVEMAKQGGYLPRWPSGHGYTNSMFGTPADMVIADTYLKGIRDFDVETAYQAMRKTALGAPPADAKFTGRKNIEEYLKYKYCPSDLMKQAVSRTLEYGYADSACARLAEALGQNGRRGAVRRARQVLSQLVEPADAIFSAGAIRKARFTSAFKPLMLTYLDPTGQFTDSYVEGSALQWRYAVPYDAPGLISLFKSREYFVEELEQFFAGSTPAVGARAERLLLARQPARHLFGLSVQLGGPARPDAKVVALDSGQEIRRRRRRHRRQRRLAAPSQPGTC